MVRMRKSTEQRRGEIASAALKIIGEHGVQGTTMARVAEMVGVSAPALYKHYGGRSEILEGAMDLLLQRVVAWVDSAQSPNAIDRLRELGTLHATMLASDYEGVVAPLFELAAAGPRSHLSAQLALRQGAVLQKFIDIVREGQRQGSIREDIDVEVIAWRLLGLTWIENLAMLEGMDEFVTRGTSARILEGILREIAA